MIVLSSCYEDFLFLSRIFRIVQPYITFLLMKFSLNFCKEVVR